ncbi:hypothetical protein [Lusitaniella coriacea]|uniref:slr1957 family protein n=1 Tax=Lusitaniella coriacea TaxID=1983105 RepID=UPI003CE8AFC6
MRHYNDDWINEWCQENGWTDVFMEPLNQYWAFPPGAVMPEPIPQKILRLIKAEKGLCAEERVWVSVAVAATAVGVTLSYFMQSPMPVVLAFAFGAIAVAKLDME